MKCHSAAGGRSDTGAPGCLSIFGRKVVQYRLLAEHLTAEHRVRTEGHGRTVDERKRIRLSELQRTKL